MSSRGEKTKAVDRCCCIDNEKFCLERFCLKNGLENSLGDILEEYSTFNVAQNAGKVPEEAKKKLLEIAQSKGLKDYNQEKLLTCGERIANLMEQAFWQERDNPYFQILIQKNLDTPKSRMALEALRLELAENPNAEISLSGFDDYPPAMRQKMSQTNRGATAQDKKDKLRGIDSKEAECEMQSKTMSRAETHRLSRDRS